MHVLFFHGHDIACVESFDWLVTVFLLPIFCSTKLVSLVLLLFLGNRPFRLVPRTLSSSAGYDQLIRFWMFVLESSLLFCLLFIHVSYLFFCFFFLVIIILDSFPEHYLPVQATISWCVFGCSFWRVLFFPVFCSTKLVSLVQIFLLLGTRPFRLVPRTLSSSAGYDQLMCFCMFVLESSLRFCLLFNQSVSLFPPLLLGN